MSDMPERIWASGGHVPEWDTHIGTFVSAADADATEYVRADKVKALVDAARLAEKQLEAMGGDGLASGLTAAILSMQEPQP